MTHDPLPVIQFENVSKRYHIQQRATPRLGAWVVNKLFEHLRRVPFDALDDVSFTINRGEMVGFVGLNGAGKSTVLKLAAGITSPTSGSIRVRGRVASMLELGVGFHPELTGLENIFYNGAVMGLTRDEVLARLETIIDFSGLRRFLYEPVKHYSSGMYARLACSVALHLDPDIILVDEILAVGDSEFQQRALMKIVDLHAAGVTILVVTHVIATARDMCDRLIWIEEGRLRLDAEPAAVVRRYNRHVAERSIHVDHVLHPDRDVVGGVRVARAWTEAPGHGPVERVATGDSLRIGVDLDIDGGAPPLRVHLAARWESGQTLFEDVSPLLDPAENGRVFYDVPRWPLLGNDIVVGIAVADAEGRVLGRDAEALRFRTDSPRVIQVQDVAASPPIAWNVEKLD